MVRFLTPITPLTPRTPKYALPGTQSRQKQKQKRKISNRDVLSVQSLPTQRRTNAHGAHERAHVSRKVPPPLFEGGGGAILYVLRILRVLRVVRTMVRVWVQALPTVYEKEYHLPYSTTCCSPSEPAD